MVASDTVVGLVGAGILLVALVGVFVYESRQGGESPELTNAAYSVTVGGNGVTSNTPTTGANGVPCTVPMTQGCAATTRVNYEFTGLADLYGGSVKYVLYLTGGPSPAKVGTLQKSGSKYQIDQQLNSDQSAQTTVAVSLEKGDGGGSPAWAFFTFPKADKKTQDVHFIHMSGNHTLSLTPSGSQLTVDSEIHGVPFKSGFVYRGWLKHEDANGMTWTFVGNFTEMAHDEGAMEHSEDEENYELAGTVAGSESSFNEFYVTAEADGSAIGSQPGGPAVIESGFNVYSASPVA